MASSSLSFRTQFQPHSRVYMSSGSRRKVHYQSRLDSRGNLVLLEDGFVDLYQEIQSHADSCDIHLILERFAAGDKDVLSQVQGFYQDFSQTPSTYQEILNAVIAGEETFNSLPVDIKDKFGHSFQRWLIEMDSPDFAQKMGFVSPTSPVTPPSVLSVPPVSGGTSDDS